MRFQGLCRKPLKSATSMEGARSKCPVGRYLSSVTTCADPESFFSWWGAKRGPRYYNYKRAIIGPQAKLAYRWWPIMKYWLGSFVFFQGIRTSIAKEPYIFVIFQEGVPDSLSPPLDARMSKKSTFFVHIYNMELVAREFSPLNYKDYARILKFC